MENNTYKDLPLYKLSINVDDGAYVDAIGIVDTPAIGVNAMYFAKADDNTSLTLEIKESTSKQFFSTDSKQELLGAAMIPDTKMFRPANEVINHDHYVMFTREEIRTIARVFFTKGCMNNINLGHTDRTASSNTFISYFIDKSNGITTPKGMSDLPDGTWVLGMYVSDKEVFNKLTKSNFGFSVEGLFSYNKFIAVEPTITISLADELNDYDAFLKQINS